MSETLEIWLGFTIPLEAGRITGLHSNANDVSRIILVHRVPKTAVTVLYANLLDVWKKTGRSLLPTVLFLKLDACRMVLPG